MFLAAALSYLEAQTPTHFIANLEAGKPQTLVAFGTSLTAGGAWVGLVDAYLKERYPGLATVKNEGASGHSSKYGLQIIHNVTRHKPDLVLIEFAMNDAYYPERDGYTEGVTVEGSKANLGIIIDSVRAVNPACEILLQTMDIPLGIHRARRPKVEAYYQGYREVAQARGLALVDHQARWEAVLAFDSSFYVSWLPDSIHPAAAASAAITLPAVLGALTGNAVTLQSPSAGDRFTVGKDIPLTAVSAAQAAPAAGFRMDFFQVKTKVGSSPAAPFNYAWKGAAAGKYLVMAKLMRGETAVAISELRRIEVSVSTATMARRLGNPKVTLGPGPRPPGFWLGRKCAACR